MSSDIPSETEVMWPHSCPYHRDHHEDIRSIKKELEDAVKKEAIQAVCNKIKQKLDRWVFVLFVSSMAVFITVASTLAIKVTSTALDEHDRIVMLEANQHIVMDHFGLHPVYDAKEGEEIVKNGKNGS